MLGFLRMEDFKFNYVGKMNTFQHGGSIAVNIPAEVVKMLKISVGEEVVFFKDEHHQAGIIVRTKDVEFLTSFGKSSLGFSMSEELVKKLLPNDEH
jgi:bifunctional DNA-binding transcriptional regulator/antitoxin component of YhaV-PrlF toxin-antitoxin module